LLYDKYKGQSEEIIKKTEHNHTLKKTKAETHKKMAHYGVMSKVFSKMEW